ncbi:MAG: hypothetical protein G01um101429_887 [Parcubacteria group bacterium Gr01-1014_29]|nr:MAG: hypothetical protein G01um101429_887 [Parcubacteria group bacterium Gr01-1014_29]
METSPLTIIDDKHMRGVIAPARTISKRMLEDIIDFIELSTPEAIRETAKRIREADQKNSWVPAREVGKHFQKRVRASKKKL